MRNAILLALAGVMVVSLVTMVAVYATPLDETPPTAGQQISQDTRTPEEYPYLLRSYQGKLAVFTTNLAQPDMVFDVYVRTLPAYDKQLLDKGIRVESYEKLARLVEDYIS